jgi:acyl carrier protein
MINIEEIKNYVFETISKLMDIPLIDICEDSLLFENLKLNDLDIIEIVVEIENNFDILISDTESSNFRTVNDIIKTTNKILENNV